jgi:hypothetical protein
LYILISGDYGKACQKLKFAEDNSNLESEVDTFTKSEINLRRKKSVRAPTQSDSSSSEIDENLLFNEEDIHPPDLNLFQSSPSPSTNIGKILSF